MSNLFKIVRKTVRKNINTHKKKRLTNEVINKHPVVTQMVKLH